jgi:hypothetical protein
MNLLSVILACIRPKSVQKVSEDPGGTSGTSRAENSSVASITRGSQERKGNSVHGGVDVITFMPATSDASENWFSATTSSPCLKQSPDIRSVSMSDDKIPVVQLGMLRTQSQQHKPNMSLFELRDRLKEDREKRKSIGGSSKDPDGVRGSKSVPLPSALPNTSSSQLEESPVHSYSRISSPQGDRPSFSFGPFSRPSLAARSGLRVSEVGALISRIKTRRRTINENRIQSSSAAEGGSRKESRNGESEEGFPLTTGEPLFPFLSSIEEDRSKK